ncbi:hypothetical protein [Rhodomicrobium sp.]|uniref:hypothetical protein n=1 Tax=Rhodomicrobium sp. TaxID=2720632 RepID=UPI0039E59C3D
MAFVKFDKEARDQGSTSVQSRSYLHSAIRSCQQVQLRSIGINYFLKAIRSGIAAPRSEDVEFAVDLQKRFQTGRQPEQPVSVSPADAAWWNGPIKTHH